MRADTFNLFHNDLDSQRTEVINAFTIGRRGAYRDYNENTEQCLKKNYF